MTECGTRSRARNEILGRLSTGERERLATNSEYVSLPAGQTIAMVGDPFSRLYFPDSGVISIVREMRTGHHLVVGVVGVEGVVGLGSLFGWLHYPLSLIALVESTGRYVSADQFRDLFEQSESVRGITLATVGNLMWEVMIAAACNRVHSHRQRLARWLLVIADKARHRSLSLTHDTLAHLVGGPRYAVTVALNHLSAKGAITQSRGRIEVLNRPTLIAQACECYDPLTGSVLYRQSR